MVIGESRTVVERNHAFIAPDGHVTAPVPGWNGCDGVILISPRMGAEFTMALINLNENCSTTGQPPGIERFIFVLEGGAMLSKASLAAAANLTKGSFAYCPPDREYNFIGQESGQLIIFDRRYTPLDGQKPPEFIVGHESEQPSSPFLGDENAQLKSLLPDRPEFDMAVNLFTFQPGTPLPFVETHIMEHGMLMVEGGGVYRLDDRWYPIQAGDVLWMGPYCPQWFGCLGRSPATYLYYKDINRDPLAIAN